MAGKGGKPAKAQTPLVETPPPRPSLPPGGIKFPRSFDVPKLPGCQASKYPFLDEIGVDRIAERCIGGETLSFIAKDIGVSLSSLLNWIDSDPTRYSMMHYARVQSALSWDHKAEVAIEKSKDPFELSVARELASHYRWRAKVVSPRDYGDRLTQEVTGANGGPIAMASVDFAGLSDQELAQMRMLLTKSAAAESNSSGE